MPDDSGISPANSLRALRRTVLQLTAVNKAICAGVIAAVSLLALHLLSRLVAFGLRLDYVHLGGFSEQAAGLLRQYMPIFWWGLAAVLALFVIHFLYRFAVAARQRAARRIVSADDFAQLVQQLSPEARAVLAWAWEDRRHPVTVGVLQRALRELGDGRAGKIHLAHTQATLLAGTAPAGLAHAATFDGISTRAEPSLVQTPADVAR